MKSAGSKSDAGACRDRALGARSLRTWVVVIAAAACALGGGVVGAPVAIAEPGGARIVSENVVAPTEIDIEVASPAMRRSVPVLSLIHI